MTKTPSEKYLHFTVSLLKGSDALEALQADAMKHHMVDHPGQLIALRLTEYYEMMNTGITQPVVRIPAVALPFDAENPGSATQERTPVSAPSAPPVVPQPPPVQQSPVLLPIQPAPAPAPRIPQPIAEVSPMQQPTSYMRALEMQIQQKPQPKPQPPTQDSIEIVVAPTFADQNADEAADYWTAL